MIIVPTTSANFTRYIWPYVDRPQTFAPLEIVEVKRPQFKILAHCPSLAKCPIDVSLNVRGVDLHRAQVISVLDLVAVHHMVVVVVEGFRIRARRDIADIFLHHRTAVHT